MQYRINTLYCVFCPNSLLLCRKLCCGIKIWCWTDFWKINLWFQHFLTPSLPEHVVSQGQLIKICSAMSIWCLCASRFLEQCISFFWALAWTAGVWLLPSLHCDPSGNVKLLGEQGKRAQVAAGFVDIKHLLGGSEELLLVYLFIYFFHWGS